MRLRNLKAEIVKVDVIQTLPAVVTATANADEHNFGLRTQPSERMSLRIRGLTRLVSHCQPRSAAPQLRLLELLRHPAVPPRTARTVPA